MSRRLLSWWVMLVVLAALRLPAQARSVALRLVPWPPQGWPAGAAGELRLVTVGLDEQTPGPPVLRVPIAPNGRVVYDLGQAEPPSQSLVTPLYELLDKILTTGLQCQLPAVVSPAEAMAVVGQFQVHVQGEETPFGTLQWIEGGRMTSLLSAASSMAFLLYVDRESWAYGGGQCSPPESAGLPSAVPVQANLHFPAGWSFLLIRMEASLVGASVQLAVEQNPALSYQLVRASAKQ